MSRQIIQQTEPNIKDTSLAVLNITHEREHCGASLDSTAKCKQPAGFATNHPGVGRCFAHDNKSHGTPIDVYEIASIKDRMLDFNNDEKILSLDKEIALMRTYNEVLGVYVDILKLEQKNGFEPQKGGIRVDILTKQLSDVTNDIRRLVETKNNIEVGRKYVIHINHFYAILSLVANVIDNCVEDTDIKIKIHEELQNIKLTD